MSTTPPIEFRRGVFYPFVWLDENLAVSRQTFLQNLNLERTGSGRMFQDGVWGDEVLDALERGHSGSKGSKGSSTRTGKKAPIIQSVGSVGSKGSGLPGGRKNAFMPVRADEVLTGGCENDG